MSTTTISSVTERVSDALSSGLSSGAGALQDVASLAVEQFESIPDRVADLTGSKSSSSRKPWLFAAAVLVAFVGVGWWMRGRRRSYPAVDVGSENGANPVRSHTDRAVAAATGQ